MSEYIVDRENIFPYGFQGEEIIRCKDCIGLVETWDGWECERFSGEYHSAEPDGFCAWASRKESE